MKQIPVAQKTVNSGKHELGMHPKRYVMSVFARTGDKIDTTLYRPGPTVIRKSFFLRCIGRTAGALSENIKLFFVTTDVQVRSYTSVSFPMTSLTMHKFSRLDHNMNGESNTYS